METQNRNNSYGSNNGLLNMKGADVVIGVVAGLVVGAAIGMLIAPDKGSETRRKISQKGGDYLQDLRDSFDGLKSKYDDLLGKVTGKADSMGTSTESGPSAAGRM